MKQNSFIQAKEERVGPGTHAINEQGFYGKKVLGLILAVAILKLIVAFTLDLGNDESYYWFYSQDLKWNYFDHPPLVAIWVRFFTLNLWLEDFPGFIRLGSIFSSGMATWAIYKTVATFHTNRAGWYAACIYNASFYAGLTAGLFIMPDAPQMLFWTVTLWMLARIIKDENDWTAWIFFGIVAGLCIMSKVHGAFLYFGLGLFMLLKKRHWFQKPQFYIAVLISLIIISPILIWNIQNNFASYRFHSQRVTIDETVEGLPFLKEVLNQVFFNNPFNVTLICMAIVAFYRLRSNRLPTLTLFNCIAWPLAGSLLFVSLFRDATLPHWSGPAYVTLFPMAAVYLAQVSQKKVWPRWIKWSLGTFVATLVGYMMLVHVYPGNLGRSSGTQMGKGDYTLDVFGWSEGGKAFETFYEWEIANGAMQHNNPVVCAKWWGAHIEYYFCRPVHLNMMGIGSLNLLHEYAWMNNRRKDKVDFTSAYCIVPSDEYYDVQQTYSPYYSNVQMVKAIETRRGNKLARLFYVYRLTGWNGKLPLVH